jgi:hypothetical protein
MSEKIWFIDIKGFLTEYNYTNFFPSREMTFAEQLNAILRFAIYFAILLFIIKRNPNVLIIVLFVAGFTYLLFTVDTQNKRRENFYLDKKNLRADPDGKICVKPTKDNPFMNVLMSEYSDNPERNKACDINKVKKKTKKYFDTDLYRDVSDIYDKNASDRNFYTTPNTMIPNDQNAFAQYLYAKDKTCKEGNGITCYKNIYRTIAN